ncbi:CitB family two-component system response regulator CitT [Geomicrobium halophilum]|uniref:Transcriptional regulatory protein n=1 Tax=Geomicrobium halophilum TaxID=549000 RepID=A0A841PHF3_9BACL|nr:response regulator [Geomicrobium halophilum]MBB6448220.1 CitB family two-component system response regulator CitT [Geomicrobium halophilum]
MNESYKVLIVEDDFRVAEINRQFIEKMDGFTVTGMAKTGEETIEQLNNSQTLPDLILLDVYIPDVEGLELLWTIRNHYHEVDVIMMTAAKEVSTIEESLRGGAFDYIVKPIEFERFAWTLGRYDRQRRMLTEKEEMDQAEIDHLIGSAAAKQTSVPSDHELPKGIDEITLTTIKDILKKTKDEGITAANLGEKIGASRSTARRYLEYLVSINAVKTELKYGDVGRPERRYIFS